MKKFDFMVSAEQFERHRDDIGIDEKITVLHAKIMTLAAVSCAQPKHKEEV